MTARSFTEIINSRPDYERYVYTRALWRTDVANGRNCLGYGETVAAILEHNMRDTPLPLALRQFIPKGKQRTPRTQALWLQCFITDGYVVYHLDYSRAYAVIAYAFSQLIPFGIYYDPGTKTVTIATAEIAKEELKKVDLWQTYYEWDGQDVPDFSELKCL